MTPEQRKHYISIANRRAKAGSGSAPAALREDPEPYGAPDLGFLASRVKFVIVGGLATSLYMPKRMTLDVDILTLPSDAPAAEAVLLGAGCVKLGPLAIGGSSWRMPDGRCLNLVVLDEPWVETAVRMPVKGKDGLPYIALEYLVLMKLGAGRVQDLADISRMLGAAGREALKKVRRMVRRHRPADMEDLDSLARLGKLEHMGEG